MDKTRKECKLSVRECLFRETSMKVPGSIKLAAGQLQEALAVAVPKRRKNSRRKQTWPITLELDNDRAILEIAHSFLRVEPVLSRRDLTIAYQAPSAGKPVKTCHLALYGDTGEP